MSSNELNGISSRTEENDVGTDKQEEENEEIKDLLDKLEVEDFSSLTQNDIDIIREELGDDKLEGILVRITDELEAPIAGVEQEEVEPQFTPQELVRRQQQQLREIESNLDALKSIGNAVNATNRLLSDVIDEIADLQKEETRGDALSPKDANVIQFNKANSKRDLVDDTNITSSMVIVKTRANNSGSIYVGTETARTDNGLELEPGETRKFPFNVSGEPIKVVAENKDDVYSYITLGLPGGV